ncbi:testis-specific serine/threonine-protein kinase 1-like [Latimeria chalumnae]|uniref:testis-specific serine/threonine-protein kinase 1-like n=1 Tax=Latimeria chalumnae TaxID=7897 RepID=UPI00313E4B78
MDLTKYGYDLGKVIGEGKYSIVRSAFCPKLGKSVAIKIIDKTKCSADFVMKFLPRVISVLTQCSHPNIVKAYEIMETQGGLCFLVMEEAKSDLYELVDSKDHLPEKEAKQIFRQIVEGLKHCHEKGIAHRDLKCENVLLTSDGTPKLSDFGFATSINGRDSKCSTFCGSLAYVAPEILTGLPYGAFQADVWSLGVMLYLLVTGYMPFDDSNLTRLREVHKQPVSFPPEPAISHSCQQLITQMLTSDPEERTNINQILEHKWFEEQ